MVATRSAVRVHGAKPLRRLPGAQKPVDHIVVKMKSPHKFSTHRRQQRQLRATLAADNFVEVSIIDASDYMSVGN